MSEYNAFAFFSVFITIYFVFMIPLGGADALNHDTNISEEALINIPDVQEERASENYVYDFEEDIIDSNNIEVVSIEEQNIDPNLRYFFSNEEKENIIIERDQAIRPLDETQTASVTFANDDFTFLDSWSQRSLTSNLFIEFQDSEQTDLSLSSISTVAFPEDSGNTFTIKWSEDAGERNLYYLEGTFDSELGISNSLGILSVFYEWIVSVINWLFQLYVAVRSLPFYFNIPFVMYIGYGIYKAVTLA